MMVIFTSRSEKKAIQTTRRILDNYANRIGNDTWQTVITADGLDTVKSCLKKNATKNMAVSCRWIRSRNRSELLWVIGKKDAFNEEGIVPVNSTGKSILHPEWENNWQYLPAVKALAALAALFHDWGKASRLFQDKLKNKEKVMDPLRHEWVSCKLLEALVKVSAAETDDCKWMDSLAGGRITEGAILHNLDLANPGKLDSDHLPPLMKMIMWLILAHHRLPVFGEYKRYEGPQNKKDSFDAMFKSFTAFWGYENTEALGKLSNCFTFEHGLLLENGNCWKKQVKKWTERLHREYSTFLSLKNGDDWNTAIRVILSDARLCLMLADHYISSLPTTDSKGLSKYGKVELYANTDPKTGKMKQLLEEHLVRDCRQAVQIAHCLPSFSSEMDKAEGIRALKKKSPRPYAWQDKAVQKIREFRNDSDNESAFFVVNIASTGCGKTIGNAKIVQEMSEDESSLRCIMAMGLRSLTLQTGDVYREQVGLSKDDLAVLIGSSAITKLHEQENNTQNNDTYEEELLEEALSYTDTENEEQKKFLNIFFNHEKNPRSSEKNQAFLYKPVLVSTIDHMMGAVETIRGGRYILPSLRLMSSDLVIDEIDDFAPKDIMAISRLIHLAGMYGRNVVISSATIPPDLAEGMYRAYKAGLSAYNRFFNGQKTSVIVLTDEFHTVVDEEKQDKQKTYHTIHEEFIRKRIHSLKKQLVRRKGYIAECGKTENDSLEERKSEYFEAILQNALKLHEQNYILDKKTGKHISFGLIRVAHINPCVELSLYLMQHNSPDGKDIYVMAYHSRQVLLLRHEEEKYLDSILTRKVKLGQPEELNDRIIRNHIDSSPAKNILFIVVATPVEEVGRDHDFDWAVVEPSSYRSVIQLAGRILRHRKMNESISHSNVAVMSYNLKGLFGRTPAFCKPGFEGRKGGPYALNTHDLSNLMDKKVLESGINAIPRIVKPNPLRPHEKLIDLEHKVLEDFNSFDDTGPQSLNGWINEYWWMTGIPQLCNRFRESFEEEINLCLHYEEGNIEFTERDGDNYIPVRNRYNIQQFGQLTPEMEKHLWITRNYLEALSKAASPSVDSEEDDLRRASEAWGTISVPDTIVDKGLYYSDQFGMFKR